MRNSHLHICKRIILFLVILNCDRASIAQQDTLFPKVIKNAVFLGKTSRLQYMKIPTPIPVEDDSISGELKHLLKKPPYYVPEKSNKHDPLLQLQNGNDKRGSILLNFEGTGNLQYKLPPDPVGAIGTNHFVQIVNMSFTIFDKSGNNLYGPAPLLTLWQEAPEPWASVSNGDPIVLYDALAGRWLITELALPNQPLGPYYLKVAVSQTYDPLGGWFLYGIEYDHFCDYPKISVWPDGYYVTTNGYEWNGSQWSFHGVSVKVLERDSLLIGSSQPRIVYFDLHPNTQPWSMLPSDLDGTPPLEGTPAYLAYLRDGEVDRIFIYKATINWSNISNSTLLWMNNLLPEPFTGSLPGGIQQPEGAPFLASLSNRLMYRLQYRYFGEYECLIANHTVNRGDDIAAIRWYELRNYGNDWEIYQQGTYSPDENHRWMGSAAVDGYGNMALGYSVSGAQVYPSVRYAGRTADAPAGILNIPEQSIIEGSGAQLNPNHRWGDYSCMSVDPLDHTTFFYTQQYYETTSDRGWQTRVSAFHINEYLTLSLYVETDSVCAGNPVQLFAVPAGGSGNFSFSWTSIPPGFTSQEQNPIVIPQTGAAYYCTVNDEVTTKTASVTIAVNPPPVANAGPDTTICSNHCFFNETASAENFSSLLWVSSGDGAFDDTTILYSTYSPGQQDIYSGYVTLTLMALPMPGCAVVSDDVELTIDDCTGIREEFQQASLTLFPNPANGKVYCYYDGAGNRLAQLSVYSLSSDLVFKTNFILSSGEQNLLFDAPMLQRGTYLVLITTDAGDHFEKILIR
jgi:hypothetical protein